MIKRLEQEAGYSLVEVMVSIMLLTIAILPMAGMFEMGLNSATSSSNYDKARTLANLKMEEAKSLPFDSTVVTVQDVKDNFPQSVADPPTTYNGNGYYQSPLKSVSGPATADFTNFQYRVEKQFMKPASSNPGLSSEDFKRCDELPTNTCSGGTQLIRVTVTVSWGSGQTYTTLGLVTG